MIYKNETNIIFLLSLLIVSSGFVIGQQDNTQTQLIDLDFDKSFERDFLFEKNIKPTLPDIGDYSVTNLTSFPVTGSTVYNHNEVITEIDQPFYQITVNLVSILVINDHDTIGAGEIFIQGGINGNKTRYPNIGSEWSLNNNDNFSINLLLLETKGTTIDISLELRDSDPGNPDDQLGVVTYTQINPNNETLDLLSDIGDARVYFKITAILIGNDITARELLDAYKPFLYVEDETGATEMPDNVVGRVISGNDQGINALVLQFYFYWETENSPDGGLFSFELHKNDFEAVLIYLDTANIVQPYRIVFNNWQYTNLDEFPAENILILEKNALPSNQVYETDISSDLQVLLGGTTETKANTIDYNIVHTWEYNTLFNLETNAEITSLYGFKTVDMTIETSYHTFDLGPGGIGYGYDYTIEALDTAKLQEWYGEVGDTFDLGTHQWSFFGIDVPIVAPFAHDVNQVFTKPYIISAYKNVVEDAGAITLAKDSYLNVTVNANLEISVNIPAQVEITYPTKVRIGTSNLDFKLIPNESNAIVSFNYDLLSNISFAYWFLNANFEMVNNGQMNVTLYDNTVLSVLEKLSLDEYEQADVPFNSYVTLDSFSITPTILGPIISGEISLDLLSVIETVLVAAFPQLRPVFKIIDFFLESISLKASPVFQTILRHPISSSNVGVTFDVENVTYTSDALIQQVEMTVSEDGDISNGIEIIVGDVNYVLDFTTDWDLVFEFKQPISSLVDDISWNIATFPSLTSNLLSSSGTSINIPADTDDVEGFDFGTLLIIGVIILAIYAVFKNRRKPKNTGREYQRSNQYEQ